MKTKQKINKHFISPQTTTLEPLTIKPLLPRVTTYIASRAITINNHQQGRGRKRRKWKIGRGK